MKLAGDLAEFSLADLVQVAGLARQTCCIRVLAAEGNGALYLESGEVVSATCEDLSGFDAFVALVGARAGHFQVEPGAQPTERNLQGNVQKLLLAANSRIEAGEAPRPTRRPLPRLAAAAADGAGAHPGQREGGRSWVFGGAAVALLLVGAVSWLAFARHEVAMKPGGPGGVPGALAASGAAEPAAVEASALTGPRDALPTLLAGQPPAAPDAASTLKPTVVCRLLVDSEGRVADAKIYRSRLDLAAFEDAAVDAVRKYRFTPGRLAGHAVPVWINWPMAFR